MEALIGGFVALIVVFFLAKAFLKMLGGVPPSSEQEALQHEVNKKASDKMNPSPNKSSFLKKLIAFILMVLVVLYFLSKG